MICPPATAQHAFDMRNSTDCAAILGDLFQAYANVVGGSQRVTVRFGERWTEYGKGNAPALVALYMTLYRQCPAASIKGLPDLNPNKKVLRGPPATGFSVYPRL